MARFFAETCRLEDNRKKTSTFVVRVVTALADFALVTHGGGGIFISDVAFYILIDFCVSIWESIRQNE